MKTSDTCPAFVSLSFEVRTAAHKLHLSSTSYAEHVALDEFYSGLVGLADKYAEVYMGLYGRVASWPRATLTPSDATTLLREYLEDVRDEQGEDKKSQALQNILAEIEELTAQTLYKLENLK